MKRTMRWGLVAGLVAAAWMTASAEVFLVDFGPSNDADGRAVTNPDRFGRYWNSWRPQPGGGSPTTITIGTGITNLISTTNGPSTLKLETLNVFAGNGINNGGLTNPSAALLGEFAVTNATEDYWFISTVVTSGFRLSSLNLDLTYSFRFFASRATAAETRTTRFNVIGANTSKFVDVTASGNNIGSDGSYDGNDNTIGFVGGIQPFPSGVITIEVSRAAGSLGYINLMEITDSKPIPTLAEWALILLGVALAFLGIRRLQQRAAHP